MQHPVHCVRHSAVTVYSFTLNHNVTFITTQNIRSLSRRYDRVRLYLVWYAYLLIDLVTKCNGKSILILIYWEILGSYSNNFFWGMTLATGIDISEELRPPPSKQRLFLNSISSYKSVRSHIPEDLALYLLLIDLFTVYLST